MKFIPSYDRNLNFRQINKWISFLWSFDAKFRFQRLTVVRKAVNWFKHGRTVSRMRALFSLVAVFFLLPIATLSATQQLLETEDGKHYLLQTSNRKKGPSTSLPQTRSRSDDYFDLRRWVRRGNQKVRYDKNMSLHCQGSLGVHGMACTRWVLYNYKWITIQH